MQQLANQLSLVESHKLKAARTRAAIGLEYITTDVRAFHKL